MSCLPRQPHLSQLHFAYGCPLSHAVIRRHPEDFQVNERLSFLLDGQGQHVFLLIQKRNLNTEQIAKMLTKFAGVKQVAIGYAGLKDKQAVTSQWFSIDLAGQPAPDWTLLECDDLKIVEVARHSRKLKRGAIAENQFKIVLSQVEGDREELSQRLEKIKVLGVPNYFGQQRFGRHDNNLMQAEKLMAGDGKRVKRHLRGIYLSAVRSYLFNQLLSRRVSMNAWGSAVDGDVFMLDGSRSVFSPDSIDKEIKQRITEGDIHPTGFLWGRGELITTKKVQLLEKEAVKEYPQLCEFLEMAGLKQERRALRLPVRKLNWEWNNDELILCFNLGAGSYATSVLRELIKS